jgi:endonuclease YncB( thermonuclease family)
MHPLTHQIQVTHQIQAPAAGQRERFLGLTVWLLLVSALVVGCTAAGPVPEEYETSLNCGDCPTLAVERIIDGDTLDTNAGRVRLFGVDTPERGEQCFDQATRALKELAGETIRVEVGPRLRDPNGRLLYYVYTESGNSLDEILISEGLALAWTRDGQHRNFLNELEANARAAGAGCLWRR